MTTLSLKLKKGVACTALPLFAAAIAGPALAQTMVEPYVPQTNVTAPAHVIEIKGSMWISDHALGFCRLEINAATGQRQILPSTCSTVAASPGQAAYDGNQYVYVPDASSNGLGVYRLTYDPNTKTVGAPVLLGRQGTNNPLYRQRAQTVAIGASGDLYVTFLKIGDVMRIGTPMRTDYQNAKIETAAKTASKGKIFSTSFVGSTLYIAELTGITTVKNIDNCQPNSGCISNPAQGSLNIPAPTTVASYAGALYAGDVSNVYMLSVCGDQLGYQTVLAGGSFSNVSAMGVDSSGNLYVGDDPSAGAVNNQGRVFKLSGMPAPTTTKCGASTPQSPPPVVRPASAMQGSLYMSSNLTLPSGIAKVGSYLWLSDHAQGICRQKTNGNVPSMLDTTTCGGPATAAAASAVDAGRKWFYVADVSSNSRGVYRMPITNAATPSINFNSSVVTAPSGDRPTAMTLSDDGEYMYVTFQKSRNVMRVTKPYLDAPNANKKIEIIGQVAERSGPSALALVGTDLYMAEGASVTKLPNVRSCSNCGTAANTGMGIGLPVALAYDGVSTLYIAELDNIRRYNTLTNTLDPKPLAVDGVNPDQTTSAFSGINVMYWDKGMNTLWVGDDPSLGNTLFTGMVWQLLDPASH
jgi:hypothetical protein